MRAGWSEVRNAARWAVVPTAGLLLVAEVVYHRKYVRMEHSPLRIATDAPETFNLIWAALLIGSILLALVSLPKWQSLVGLLLVFVVVVLRVNAP
jgi:hypothetical protein